MSDRTTKVLRYKRRYMEIFPFFLLYLFLAKTFALESRVDLQVKNHFWDRSQNRTTFGTGGFGVTESDIAVILRATKPGYYPSSMF